ncbi:16S rRNA (guanine(966)-N(2))-methyltransferase RsmD [Edaphobacter sp. 12200R-103]|uniref:16S rRNA (guanine(966)-N(2))-methyltransferase RsmD n=1 Tax=Edaphobacter sp. 12200R-103 TaxID=2703788 RepID=UPI00138CB841|nr:16S rRNA (guanine(966)-N(2))-methyltransferase RsmD [Edaphobacter sp. 12200R-103]QHS50324.1 16S rRNA (guanine(966)-N(2))-methyltransferase RsmD [Edaphobacter sp. 12200R-103]
MRVIAGRFRSRPLSAPRGLKTRPTSDRLRETLFNVLSQRIAGARFVDLYAGSGAVGIEALSRDAEFVWFAESAAPAIRIIRENLASLEIADGYQIEAKGAMPLLDMLARTSATVDLIFLDPPYEEEKEYSRVLNYLGEKGARILAEDARVIAEHRAKSELAESYGELERVRVLKQGDAALSFYAKKPQD